MRGNIFENMIITDLIKTRFNQSKKSNVYFWRDHVGKEVDVIIEKPNLLTAIEIKSGKTVTSEYFKNINYWAKLTKENSNYILYGGTDTQLRSEVSVLPWKEIEKIDV